MGNCDERWVATIRYQVTSVGAAARFTLPRPRASGKASLHLTGQGTISMTHDAEITIDQELDLKGVVCPYNYVKTKLKLEEMTEGQVLRVTIDDGEPVRNVPRSVTDEGHQVLRIEPYQGRHYRVTIRKCGD